MDADSGTIPARARWVSMERRGEVPWMLNAGVGRGEGGAVSNSTYHHLAPRLPRLSIERLAEGWRSLCCMLAWGINWVG